MRISEKFIGLFLLASLLPLLVASNVLLVYVERQLIAQKRDQLEDIARRYEKELDALVDQRVETLNLMVNRAQLRLALARFFSRGSDADRATVASILEEVRANVPGVRSAIVFDSAGGIVAASPPVDASSSELLTDIFTRGKGGESLSLTLRDREGRLRSYTAAPLMFEDVVIGVVAMEVDSEPILAIFSDRTGLGETGEVYLITRDTDDVMVFLVPPRFKRDAVLVPSGAEGASSGSAFYAATSKEEFLPNARDDRGRAVFVVTRAIERTDWKLILTFDRTEALFVLTRIRNILMLIIVLTIFFALLLALFLAGIISAPIRELTAAAERIRGGNLTVPVAVRSRDEIGQLAAAFASMAEELRATYGRLAAAKKRLEEQVRITEAKNEDLKRFNQLAVGRELRMAELKEEIEMLRRKLAETAEHSSQTAVPRENEREENEHEIVFRTENTEENPLRSDLR